MIPVAIARGQDRCESDQIPLDSRCSGCPPMHNGKLCASTTRYNDQTKGACGCGPSDPVPADFWTMTQFTAALNCKNLDPVHPDLSWCPGGCGGCYELCTTGGTTQGKETEEGVCHVFKVSNRCGDGYKEYPEWCSNEMSWQECADDPATCKQKGNTNKFGYSAHFDLEDFASQISVGQGWDNVEVTFEPVSCDLWDGPAWDCQCDAVDPLPVQNTTTATPTPSPSPSGCPGGSMGACAASCSVVTGDAYDICISVCKQDCPATPTTTTTMTPSPSPSPSGCPGGSLPACIQGCPTNPAVFAVCVQSCEAECTTTTPAPAPSGMCCWQDCQTLSTCLPSDACSNDEDSCHSCSGIWCSGPDSILV